MLASIPWDIWAAAVLAAAVALLGIFGPAMATVIALYLSMCTYVIVATFTGEVGRRS